MIWDETADPAIIVMLTQTHESGREKCHAYFPLDESHPALELNSEDEFQDGITLTMILKDAHHDDATETDVRDFLVYASREGERPWSRRTGEAPKRIRNRPTRCTTTVHATAA